MQKLILGLILDTPPIVFQYAGGYDKTCTEIATQLGTTRNVILAELNELIRLELITSEKGLGWRISKVTQRLKELLKMDKSTEE